MHRAKIKVRVSSPDSLLRVLLRAIKTGYTYRPNQYDALKHAHGLILHPEYGIYPVRDEEFNLHIDFTEVKEEDFLS